MKCLNCDSEKFELKNTRFNLEIKGEEVEIEVPSFTCIQCQTSLMNGEQMNLLRKSAADTYRKKHRLLTSEEIIKFRASLGMSQATFASYLEIEEVSIKQWETYYIQDVAQNNHLRLKCDE